MSIIYAFNFQLDVLSSGNSLHEVAHIANGSHPRNCVSLLRINVSIHSSPYRCCFYVIHNAHFMRIELRRCMDGSIIIIPVSWFYFS